MCVTMALGYAPAFNWFPHGYVLIPLRKVIWRMYLVWLIFKLIRHRRRRWAQTAVGTRPTSAYFQPVTV